MLITPDNTDLIPLTVIADGVEVSRVTVWDSDNREIHRYSDNWPVTDIEILKPVSAKLINSSGETIDEW